MTLTSLSIALTVYILHLHHAGPLDRRRVPSWMRRHFIRRLGRALGVRHPAINHAASPRRPPRSSTATNPVDPDASVVVAGYLPLTARPAREHLVENTGCPPTKRRGHRDAGDDLITHQLRLYLDRRRADQQLEELMTEWRLLALIFDRLMFWLFLVGTALSTIFILLILPLTKPVDNSQSHQPQNCQSLWDSSDRVDNSAPLAKPL